jgi:hypothetical protein
MCVAYCHHSKKYIIANHDKYYCKSNGAVLGRCNNFLDYILLIQRPNYTKKVLTFDTEEQGEEFLLKFKRQKKLEKL